MTINLKNLDVQIKLIDDSITECEVSLEHLKNIFTKIKIPKHFSKIDEVISHASALKVDIEFLEDKYLEQHEE